MRRFLLHLAMLATFGADNALAQAVAPLPVVDIPIPTAVPSPPRLLDRVDLFRPGASDSPRLAAAFVRRDGVLVVLIHENGDEDAPARLRRVEVGPDGRVVATTTLEPIVLQRHAGMGTGPWVVRGDGTAAALEARTGMTGIVEIRPDGSIARTPVPAGGPGFLYASGETGHLAAMAERRDASKELPFSLPLVWIRRDGSIAWRAPTPPRQGVPTVVATAALPDGILVSWSAVVRGGNGDPLQRIGTAWAKATGLAPARLSAGFVADGAGVVLKSPVPFPGPAPAGYFISGWLFGGDALFCGWLGGDGRLRLHNSTGPRGNRAIACPTEAAVALADGSVIGMARKSLSDGLPQSLLRAGADGNVLWQQERADSKDVIHLILFGGPDTIWLLGETRAGSEPVERLFAERRGWR